MRTLLRDFAAAGALLAAAPAMAAENWSPHLPGVTEGLPAGALPPPGVYFINSTAILPFTLYDKNGDKTPVKADIFVEAPILLWTPGIKLFGADYAAGIAQPMTYVSASGGGLDRSGYGLFSTILMPAKLSWALPNDVHLLAGLSVYAPTGRAQKSVISDPNGTYTGIPNSIHYWSVEPTLGISWLHDGWNVSASVNYDINFKNTVSGYTSGDILVGDYTVTKTVGKWTFGVGGYSVNQLTRDRSTSPGIQAGIDASDGNKQTKYGAGLILGYDFGPVSLTGYHNHGFGTRNDLSGESFWTRLLVPF